MQQPDSTNSPKHIHPKRVKRHPHQFVAADKWRKITRENEMDLAAQPTPPFQKDKSREAATRLSHTGLQHNLGPVNEDIDDDLPEEAFDVTRMSTGHLMKLSGMMQAIKVQRQTGVYPLANFYSGGAKESFAANSTASSKASASTRPTWKVILNSPTARIVISLVAGIILLYLTIKSINIQTTFSTLTHYLLTPLGITYALISGGFFFASFTLRGLRWKLFLNPIGKISTIRVVQLFWIGVFINFLLPIRGGELAKSLMLKRTAAMPISQTLPTVAMDKALDLMPALFVMAIVPLLPGVHMTLQLWLVLSVVAGLLLGLIFFIALAAWKRTAAISFMKLFTRFLPKGIGSGIEGFATGFVDSLLRGASQPKIFVPAVLLTIVAVLCDGLFALFAFWCVGLYMPFGMAIFGYTMFNMFCVLPNAPAGIGSNEATGAIVFTGLLGYNANSVQAMFVFSHPWTTLIMTVIAIASLSSLGLSISSAMKMRVSSDDKAPVQEQAQDQREAIGA